MFHVSGSESTGTDYGPVVANGAGGGDIRACSADEDLVPPPYARRRDSELKGRGPEFTATPWPPADVGGELALEGRRSSRRTSQRSRLARRRRRRQPPPPRPRRARRRVSDSNVASSDLGIIESGGAPERSPYPPRLRGTGPACHFSACMSPPRAWMHADLLIVDTSLTHRPMDGGARPRFESAATALKHEHPIVMGDFLRLFVARFAPRSSRRKRGARGKGA